MSKLTAPPGSEPLLRLREVTAKLAELHQELAATLQGELEAKVEAYRNSESSSESGRRLDGTVHSAHFTGEVFRLKGEIDAWREEKTYVLRLLDADEQ